MLQRDFDATCGTCPWWHGTGDEVVRARDGLIVERHQPGTCRLSPVRTVERKNADWCAEHPANVKLRVQAEERWRMEARSVLAAESAPPPDGPPRAPDRCAVCGWPLAASREDGCVRGDCAYRGHPRPPYDAERAERERELTGATAGRRGAK